MRNPPRRKYPSDHPKRPREKQHKQTEDKYRRLRGERAPIVGGSLEELERKLAAL